METIDAAVARWARTHHGLVTLSYLGEIGATRAVVRHRLATGRWVKVDRQVLRVGGAPVTWESQLLAKVLAAGEGAVASHRSAAALWGLDGFHKARLELTVPNGRRYRRPDVRTHESTDLHLVMAVNRDGIPTTPVARTLLDLGAVVSLDRVHVAVDHARRRRLVDWNHLLATLVAHARRGRDGVGTLRTILDEHFGEVAVTDSGFERLVIALLAQAGMPRPTLQHEVTVGHRTYRLDLAYPHAHVAIELDGSIHLRRDVWEADRARQNALILSGWRVLRFTWRDYLERPDTLVSQIRAALPSEPSSGMAAQ